MKGLKSFRRLGVLGLTSSVLLALAGCGDPMVVRSGDKPEKVAASFVYWIGKDDYDDATALVYSTEERPRTIEYGNMEQLRQRAGMNPGCVLGDSWESRVSVVDEGDNFRVTVPLRCGNEQDTTTLTVTKYGNEWGKHWVVVD